MRLLLLFVISASGLVACSSGSEPSPQEALADAGSFTVEFIADAGDGPQLVARADVDLTGGCVAVGETSSGARLAALGEHTYLDVDGDGRFEEVFGGLALPPLSALAPFGPCDLFAALEPVVDFDDAGTGTWSPTAAEERLVAAFDEAASRAGTDADPELRVAAAEAQTAALSQLRVLNLSRDADGRPIELVAVTSTDGSALTLTARFHSFGAVEVESPDPDRLLGLEDFDNAPPPSSPPPSAPGPAPGN